MKTLTIKWFAWTAVLGLALSLAATPALAKKKKKAAAADDATATQTDTTTTKSNLKSTKTMSKGKAKDTTIHATSTLTQALDFICTHLVGRQEVRKRRAQISQCVTPRPITQFCRQLRGMI